MPDLFAISDDMDFVHAAQEFWHKYYCALKRVHEQEGRALSEPVRDRNLSTTDSKHVVFFEEYCRHGLAKALDVPVTEVGKRKIKFNDYRSKSFDVCWPLTGEPKIMISVKSMQNAYRNFTNRIEEAFGDSAVLRIYRKPACFGFFFFMVDGIVARGNCEMAKPPPRLDAQGKPKQTKGAEINLALLEQGGDFFDISEISTYRTRVLTKERKKLRQDVVVSAQRTLIDLLAEKPQKAPTTHYDSMAFVPASISRIAEEMLRTDWAISESNVDPKLSRKVFFERLVETARLRGFI